MNGTGSPRTKTYPYFRYLPYEIEDEAERQANLDEILKHLYVAIEAGDFAPGAVHWTREIRNWLGLKFQLSKEQRITLAKLYYELSLAPGVDSLAADRFASMFMTLTKYSALCIEKRSIADRIQKETLLKAW